LRFIAAATRWVTAKGAEDVDLEHRAQTSHGNAGEGAGLAAAGIGDEHIEVPLIDRGHILRIRDVELGDRELRMGAENSAACRSVSTVADDAVAAPGELNCGVAAEARCPRR